MDWHQYVNKTIVRVSGMDLDESKESSCDQTDQFKSSELSYQYKDLDLITDGAFIPRRVYKEKIEANHNITKTMYNVYLALCYHCRNNQGQVVGLSTRAIADWLKQENDARVKLSLKQLEAEGLIIRHKEVRPYSYTIIGFAEALTKGSQGGAVIPKEAIFQMLGFTLKHYRLVFYLMIHRHHMPNNKLKKEIKQETLLKLSNCVSYIELKDKLNDLVGVIFDQVDKLHMQVIKTAKRTKKLFFNFKEAALGILNFEISDLEKIRIKDHHYYKRLKKIFKRMNIKSTWINLKRGLHKIEALPEYCFIQVEEISKKDTIRSTWGTVKAFEGLMDKQLELIS